MTEDEQEVKEEQGNIKIENMTKLTGRLISNKIKNNNDNYNNNHNNDNDDDDDFPMTVEEPSMQITEHSFSARQLRLRLATMTKNEKSDWRSLAQIPGTVQHAGKNNVLTLVRLIIKLNYSIIQLYRYYLIN